MDGNGFDLSEERATWAFVHFWASWCTPCRREMPRIQAMSERLGDLPLAIVLVNTAETEDTVFAFLAAVAPDLMDTLLDRDGLVTERWQPRGLPSTFLVDPAGRIRYLVLGGREWDRPEYLEFLRGLAQGP
jgi:thiol-disulfide isomerase/thioredoxin